MTVCSTNKKVLTKGNYAIANAAVLANAISVILSLLKVKLGNF